jgi:hypothetical protein
MKNLESYHHALCDSRWLPWAICLDEGISNRGDQANLFHFSDLTNIGTDEQVFGADWSATAGLTGADLPIQPRGGKDSRRPTDTEAQGGRWLGCIDRTPCIDGLIAETLAEMRVIDGTLSIQLRPRTKLWLNKSQLSHQQSIFFFAIYTMHEYISGRTPRIFRTGVAAPLVVVPP